MLGHGVYALVDLLFISAKAVKNYILTSVFTKVISQKCMHAEDEHIRQ